ncbi:nuclear transport factor 2 family protein [Micromonospora humidisoli]|uniref:Ketosteroid isomerase-related protein n=1 Tax=Micromonospora humidisoli TaxID=2807622 RepID=A0ABS2JHY0_9ACTN|nr:hypothetical protein [Micromonospora humidisoli]MBM7085826.1 hypothetical protein [Micromonospora humidisoli]
MTRAVRAGMDFVSALDRGSLGGLARLCAADATWWVDTGPDRRGGDPALAPHGSGRFPLHGLMRMGDKLALMRSLGPHAFPTGCRQIPRRIVAGDDTCVIEVEGYGVHASGREYANRYGFVVDVDPTGAIVAVREYLDTAHAQHVVGDDAPVPRSSLDDPPHHDPPDPVDVPPALATALAMWPALARGDLDANGPLHGRVAMSGKLAAMRARLAGGTYRSPGIAVTADRWIVDDTLVAVEAHGHAVLGDGARYQNRYLWIVDVRPGGIAGVREYCDTLHVTDLLGVAPEADR